MVGDVEMRVLRVRDVAGPTVYRGKIEVGVEGMEGRS